MIYPISSGFVEPVVKNIAISLDGSTGPTGPTDEYFSNVSLLVQEVNTGDLTDITDSSNNNHTLTPQNGAAYSSDQAKFGTYSLIGDGLNNYIQCPSPEDSFNISTGDWTVECWIYLNSITAISRMFSMRTTDTNMKLLFSFDGTNGLRAASYNGSYQFHCIQNSNSGWSTGTWYHVCAERSGNTFRTYRDGNIINTHEPGAVTLSGGFAATELLRWPGGSAYFDGYMQDFRFTKGVARYDGAFTPPDALFPTQ